MKGLRLPRRGRPLLDWLGGTFLLVLTGAMIVLGDHIGQLR